MSVASDISISKNNPWVLPQEASPSNFVNAPQGRKEKAIQTMKIVAIAIAALALIVAGCFSAGLAIGAPTLAACILFSVAAGVNTAVGISLLVSLIQRSNRE